MPFSIATQPVSPTLSGNDMIYRIACADGDGNPFTWRGVRSRILAVDDIAYFAAADILILSFQEPDFGPSHSVLFTCSDTPTGIAEFPSTPTGTWLEYWQEVANIIGTHPDIVRLLDVYAEQDGDGYKLWAVAKSYEIGWTVHFQTSTGGLTLTDYTSPASTMPSNYRLNADVWVESSFQGTPVRRAILDAIPDRNSEVLFNISSIIHAGIKDSFPQNIPAFSANVPQVWDIMRGYYLRFWENIGEESSTYDDYEISSTQLALCGGIANSFFPDTNFFGTISASNSLLTWRPSRRTVGEFQPEWISWYNYTPDVVSPAIQVTYYYPDGTNYTNILLTEHGVMVESNQVALIPVGFQTLDGVARIQAVKYSITVGSMDDDEFAPLSPTITYFVDYAYHLSTRYLLYLNSFCALEVLRCYGDVDTDLEVDRELFDSTLPPGYASSFRQRGQYEQDWDNAYTYYTGHLSKQEAETLQELLIYGKVWEITENHITPLRLQGKKFAITSTRQNLHSYAIEAIRAINERWYTPADTMVAIPNWLLDDESDPLLDDEGAALTEG